MGGSGGGSHLSAGVGVTLRLVANMTPQAQAPFDPAQAAHDTLVLQHDTVALPRPQAGAPAATEAPDTHPTTALPWPAAPHTSESVPGWGAVQGTPYGWAPAPAWELAPRAPLGSTFPPAYGPLGVDARPVIVMRNNAAVVGATLGSVALLMSVVPIIGILAWVIAPIGGVTSMVGLSAGISRRTGRFAATWGLLTSGAALAVCIAWLGLLLAI